MQHVIRIPSPVQSRNEWDFLADPSGLRAGVFARVPDRADLISALAPRRVAPFNGVNPDYPGVTEPLPRAVRARDEQAFPLVEPLLGGAQ